MFIKLFLTHDLICQSVGVLQFFTHLFGFYILPLCFYIMWICMIIYLWTFSIFGLFIDLCIGLF